MIHDLTPAPVSTATITSPASEQAELFSAEASPSRIRERSPSGTRRSRSADQKRTAALNRTGLKAPSPVGKNFVLDTNVLLHDPECIRHFEENHICIPFDVLRELDKFKQEPSERGANARQVHRTLTQMFTDHAEAATQGVMTPGGGTIRMVICHPVTAPARKARERLQALLPEPVSTDHQLLICVEMLRTVNAAPVILVTKDLNLRLKAMALGLACEDYETDKVCETRVEGPGIRALELDPHDLQRFASTSSEFCLPELGQGLEINEYVLLSAAAGRALPARHEGAGKFVRLRFPESLRVREGAAIRPLNLGQQCLLDALLNPRISLVTCFGQAGTGKTLLAVASALHAVTEGGYSGLTVSRPIVAMGETLGFLPGSLEEKLHPWLKPIYDALEFILVPPHGTDRSKPRKPGAASPTAGKSAGKSPRGQSQTAMPPAGAVKCYQPYLDSGLIEIEALCYIRGRSIPNRFFILDEAQQITPHEAKTIVTRMAKGSKLVLVGDPAQIDNPFVDRRSNGLVYTREKMRNQVCSAHISLNRGERSELAEMAARLM
ncbi:MAG: PhoH family protein [Verrucomicrobiales bacterium]